MSNLRDAVGLCIPCVGSNSEHETSQYETQFEPANQTLWGYFSPKESPPCFSLRLLKDITAHEEAFVANQGRVRIGDEDIEVNHYVVASRTPGVRRTSGTCRSGRRRSAGCRAGPAAAVAREAKCQRAR